jgi:MoaA/NifB/PqqE/SkfB family radical SAM enzyme
MTIKLTPDVGENFCYAPWTNIHINPQGDYKTCCAGDSILTNLRQSPIESGLENPVLTEIKHALLSNKPHSNCRICFDSERHSNVSERTWYNDIAERRIIPIAQVNEQVIQNLDIRWNNTCNLSCVYCGDEASSIWAQLKGRQLGRTDYGPNLSGVIEHVERNRATIKNLALLGGEPLLQKENEALLDVIDNDVHVNVITNLSVPLEKNKIFNRLIEMNNVMWDVSFETTGARFEYVRHGASWTTMLENLAILKQATQGRTGQNVDVTGQLCVYNGLNLSEVFETFRDLDLPSMRLNELIYPEVLSVYSLPNHLMQRVADEIDRSIPFVDDPTRPVRKEFLQRQSANLRKATNPGATVDALYEWHAEQEQRYWPDTKLRFSDLWPEFRE